MMSHNGRDLECMYRHECIHTGCTLVYNFNIACNSYQQKHRIEPLVHHVIALEDHHSRIMREFNHMLNKHQFARNSTQ